MAIKTVTQANLAEHVAEKRAQGSNIQTQEQVAALAVKPVTKTEEKPEGDSKDKGVVVATGEEKLDTAPEPQGEQKREPKKDRKNSVQDRIDELTREKRELEEFAEGEYSGRLSAQRRIDELERQLQALQPKTEPKVEEDPEPDPAKYDDQKKFLKEWGEWNRKKAIRDFQAEETKRRQREQQEATVAELNARREASVKAAKEALPDFESVIKQADRGGPVPPDHVKAAIWESEYGAHILYTLAKSPDEAKRIFNLRPAASLLELGRIASTFAKGKEPESKPAAAETSATTTQPQTSRAPAPMPALNGGIGEIPHDFAKPQNFREYKQRRIDEIRRRRGH